MKIRCIIIFLILSTILSSQNTIDSLINEINNTRNDSILINDYLELSFCYFSINLDSSKFYLNRANDYLNNKEYQSLRLKYRNNLGNYFFTKGDNQKAKENYDIGYQLSKSSNNDEYEKRFTINYARLSIRNGNYYQALKFYLDFESKIDTNSKFQKSILSKFYQNKSVCNTYLKKYDDAEKDLKNIIKFANNSSDSLNYYFAYTNLLYLKNFKFDTIRPFFNKALEISKKNKNIRLELQLLTLAGESLYENDQLDEGLKYINNAITLSKSHKFEFEENLAKYHQSFIFYKMKKNKLALDQCKALKKYYEDNDETRLLIQCIDLMTNIYSQEGKYKEAFEALKDADALREKTVGEDQQKLALELETQYDLNNKQKQIEEKEFENQLQKEKLNIEKKQKYFIFLLLSISIMFLIWALFNYSKKQKLYKILENQKIILQLKSEELSKTNQLKDKLFAMISHDLRSPVSNLFDNMILWDTVKSTRKRTEETVTFRKMKLSVENLQHVINNVLQWASSQIKNINPNRQYVKLKPLINNIEQQLIENLRNKDIKLISYIEDEVVVFDENQLNIVLRNLISNAIKYSQPDGFILIGMVLELDHNVLYIKDKGIGIQKDILESIFNFPISVIGTKGEKGTGIGLSITKELIEKNNCKLIIESQENIGTTVKIIFKSENII